MNPDTAPIAEVEEWLAPRLGWTNYGGKWSCDGGGEFTRPMIGHAMEDAIACLPPGWDWQCNLVGWHAHCANAAALVERSMDDSNARDELLRLAAKAWQAEESQ